MSANSEDTQRTVPGAIDVVGTANSNATVTVNTGPTYRHSDYFRAEPKVDNRTSPVYTNLSTIGVLANGTNKDIVTTNSGNALLPKNPEALVYDADGNLTTNGLWILTWDAENRLVGLDPISTIPDAAKKSLRFKYDFQGRRISKIVSNWTGSAWSLSYSTKFIHDGWNLLAEVNATNNSPLRKYVWGIDASGTAQEAGGTGGLLTIQDSFGASTTNLFLGYDGNHNVRLLVTSGDGAIAGEYDYDPFGNSVRISGNFGLKTPIRFSTRYQDSETSWSYYGFRYLANGSWIGRDPIGESGGPALMAFVLNSPLSNIDPLGQDATTWPYPNVYLAAESRAAEWAALLRTQRGARGAVGAVALIMVLGPEKSRGSSCREASGGIGSPGRSASQIRNGKETDDHGYHGSRKGGIDLEILRDPRFLLPRNTRNYPEKQRE